MEIKDHQGLTDFLIKWIEKQARISRHPNGVVGISGGVDSAVVFALCVHALPLTVGVKMPCGSSQSSINRANELIDLFDNSHFNFITYEINLDAAFDLIIGQANAQKSLPGEANKNAEEGALRSCLRAPVLDFFGKRHSALVYGTGNRDEDEIFRYYQKRGDGAVDNNPIAVLHKSEVWSLARYLGVPESIVTAEPTADLWGPDSGQSDEVELGLTYHEIEWITLLNSSLNILERRANFLSKNDFAKEYAWLSPRQLEIVEKAWRAEAASRHKALPPPGPKRDDIRQFF